MNDFNLSEKYWASKPKHYPRSKGVNWELVKDDFDPYNSSNYHIRKEIQLKKIYCQRDIQYGYLFAHWKKCIEFLKKFF